MQWDMYVVHWTYFLRGISKKVKCIYARPLGHIVDCSDLKQGIYTDMVVSYLHIN